MTYFTSDQHFGHFNIIRLSPCEIEQIVGKTLPPDEVARLCEEKEAIYRKLYKPKLPDGLREWLDYAHARKIPCALALSRPYAASTRMP